MIDDRLINQDRSCPKNVSDVIYFECLFTYPVILGFFSWLDFKVLFGLGFPVILV